MNQDELIEKIREACKSAGGQAAFARSLGVTKGMINHVLTRRASPGPKILDPLGLRAKTIYVPKQPSSQAPAS